MQIRFLSAVFFMVFLFCSCTEQKSQTSQQTKKDSIEEHTFFPVTEYILGELAQIDSLPVTPLKIISIDGKDDSIWMKKENIRVFAEPFLHPEIDSTYLNKFYEEKSFLDQTINSITLTYDPKNNSADFKTVTVYINPQNNKVTRIYMIKEITGNTGRETVQLTWNAYHWCKITTITEQGNNQPKVKEEKMIWNFNEP